MSTIDDLNKYKGTLVIDSLYDNVGILCGSKQEDDEEWWVFSNGESEYYIHAILDWIPLKGIIPDSSYKHMVDRWNMNHEKKCV